MLHRFEEPCISGKLGSGAVFFCGCPLGCVFCQNGPISRKNGEYFAKAKTVTVKDLASYMISLQQAGAHNVNLVSPTQYTAQIIDAVAKAKALGLTIPVVWNTGGYEKPETIKLLYGTVDVFLTDVKYCDGELSAALSKANDYFEYALSSLEEMVRITGEAEFDEDGIMKRGVILRHLVLPGCRLDSEKILRKLAERGLEKKVLLSLMSQYTPDFFAGCGDVALDKKLRRRVTTFEYNYVSEIALELGFSGFGQDRTSAITDYTPLWENDAQNFL